MDNADNTSHTPEPQSSTGRVKWFNNKAGYGFITVSDGEQSGTDVFVHHSSIIVDKEQYRYLVQGEYVSFKMMSVESEQHQWQANEVRGINNGKLMCETRMDSRTERSNTSGYDNTHFTSDNNRPKSRGQGPRSEWMLVRTNGRRDSFREERTDRYQQPRETFRPRVSKPN